MPLSMQQLVASPACLPQWPLEQILTAYRPLGFKKFEAFCTWCKSALDIQQPPADYLRLAEAQGFRFTSMHLPAITHDFDASLAAAIATARYAASLGASVVIYKADSRENYIRAAGPFLDALQSEGVAVTPVLQNHKGSPITTLDDFRAVIEGVNDPRMKTLLEVGHFQRAGVAWRDGYDLLGDSIALVHINDINAASESVPFGAGLVDFPGLFQHLSDAGYAGDMVVELELPTRNDDPDRTLGYLGEALQYLRSLGLKD